MLLIFCNLLSDVLCLSNKVIHWWEGPPASPKSCPKFGRGSTNHTSGTGTPLKSSRNTTFTPQRRNSMQLYWQHLPNASPCTTQPSPDWSTSGRRKGMVSVRLWAAIIRWCCIASTAGIVWNEWWSKRERECITRLANAFSSWGQCNTCLIITGTSWSPHRWSSWEAGENEYVRYGCTHE